MEIKVKELKKILKAIGKKEASGKYILSLYDDNNFDMINSDLEKVIKYKYRTTEDFDEAHKVGEVFEVDCCITGIIDKLPNEDILNITLKDNFMTIKKGRMNFNVTICRDIIYNEVEAEEKNFLFYLKRELLKEALEKTITAVTKTDKIPDTMKCLCFKVDKDKGILVGTDMSRLYTYNFVLDTTDFTEQDVQYIIPSKNALEIIRSCDSDTNELCELYDCNNMLFIKFKNIDICVNVFAEQYKDYNRILNYVVGERIVEVDGREFKNILSPIIAFASGQIFTTTVKLLFKPNEIIVSSCSDRGNIEDAIECLGNVQEDREIVFNGNILFDIITHLSDNKIRFIFDDLNTKPIKILNNSGNIVDVILPLQAQNN